MPLRDLVGFLVGWLIVATGTLFAADPQPATAPKVEAKAPTGKTPESDPRLPPIPIRVLLDWAQYSGPRPVPPNPPREAPSLFEEIAISDQQRSELVRLAGFNNRWLETWCRARQAILGCPYAGSAAEPQSLVTAFEQVAQQQRGQLGVALNGVLSPEQRAVLRRRFRSAARDGRVRPETPVDQHSEPDKVRVEDQTKTGDMLGLLLVGSVQDRLEITDEQYLALCDLRDRSVSAAILVIEAEIAAAELAGSDKLESVFEELPTMLADGKAYGPAVQQLSEDQQSAYARFFEIRTPERKLLIEGFLASVSTSRDAVVINLDLHNPVEMSEELRETLALTREQRLAFADAVKVEEERLERLLLQRLSSRVERSQQAAARGAEWRQRFVAEWNTQALALLTSAQQEKLPDQNWCARGVRSLLDPEFAKRLNLTDKQQTDLRKLLNANRPAAIGFGNRLPQPGETAEEFRRRLEQEDEKQAAYIQAVVVMEKAAIEVLTAEQRKQFLEITGYRVPAGFAEPPVVLPGAGVEPERGA
jgi:hypothetical protein